MDWLTNHLLTALKILAWRRKYLNLLTHIFFLFWRTFPPLVLTANNEGSMMNLAEEEGWRRCVKCRTLVEVRNPIRIHHLN